MSNNISSFNKGLNSDSSPKTQPEGTYRFALNAIEESDDGDVGFLSNEQSTKRLSSVGLSNVIIGSVYIGDEELCIFSVTEGNNSEIGILDKNDNYTAVVNDGDSLGKDKLNFSPEVQIQAIYRLRRGCEKTVYFVYKDNKPKYFNFSTIEKFKKGGLWKSSLFDLQKQYGSIPEFEEVEVLNSGGSITPGSYNIAIQLIDEDLNPTEFIAVTPTINIYNSSLTAPYRDITGSINSEASYQQYPDANKAIKIKLSNLDDDYIYYRLAIIKANTGSGEVNSVVYSELLATGNNEYIYTGKNAVEEGSIKDIEVFNDIISSAGSIAQIENKLLLGNTKGKQVDFCAFQKYASKIQADCVTKDVNLSDVKDTGNSKNPSNQVYSVGYMPGEIYSFGIVYILEDNTLSPVYHIPGKNPTLNPNHTFTSQDNVSSMALDNAISTKYIDEDSCVSSDLWGRDSEGYSLKGKNVRHHRFPLRSEINTPLVEVANEEGDTIIKYSVLLTMSGTLIVPEPCIGDDCVPEFLDSFEVLVRYIINGVEHSFTKTIDPNFYENEGREFEIFITEQSPNYTTDDYELLAIEITDEDGNFEPIVPLTTNTVEYTDPTRFAGKAEFKAVLEVFEKDVSTKQYKSKMLGIKFSNIQIPQITGSLIKGFYIVRNKRGEFDKTILDSGILLPTIKNDRYTSQGLLKPENADIDKQVYGLLHLEHKFKGKEYTEYDTIIQEGSFKVVDQKYGKFQYNDVFEGSSVGSGDKSGNDDGRDPDGDPHSRGYDGWSLDVITRDNIVEFETGSNFTIGNEDIKDNFYLDALDSRSVDEERKEVFNIAGDNKIGILNLEDGITIPEGIDFPYVILKKTNLNAYSDFRTRVYYKENLNPVYFDSTTREEVEVYSGDSYITPLRYVNTVFWDNRVAERKGKSNFLKKLAGGFLAVLGTAIIAGTFGLGAPLGIAVAGAGLTLFASGLKLDAYKSALLDKYNKGLKETALDKWVETFYQYTDKVIDYFPVPWAHQTQYSGYHARTGPSDDTIQWIGEAVTDLWFESTINANLRLDMTDDTPTFMHAPGRIEDGNNRGIDLWEYYGRYYADGNQARYPESTLENHMAKKLLVFDEKKNDNYEYIGYPLGEYYGLNADYERVSVEKMYFHLPLEYSCCSDCTEEFPHRWRWSEESFQEELTDNYRVFLPNNYKDIQGETGEITNIFALSDQLFIHTKEALYMVPKNQQERITDQVVSFIGTGNFGALPARKMLEDNSGMSAGLQHKFSAIVANGRYFFVSETQRVVYAFDGRQLIPISRYGISRWFNNNLTVKLDEEYFKASDREYPYKDNPSNKFGTGYSMTYDDVNNRVLVTKKDFIMDSDVYSNEDFRIISNKGNLYIIRDYQSIIDSYISQGYIFRGIRGINLVFDRVTTLPGTKTEFTWIPPVYGEETRFSRSYFRGTFNEFPGSGSGNTGVDPGDDFPDGGVVRFINVAGEEVSQSFFYHQYCYPVDNLEILEVTNAYTCSETEEIVVRGDLLEPGYFEERTVTIGEDTVVEEVVPAVRLNEPVKGNLGWTLSFSMTNPEQPYWISWHSYLPNIYLRKPNKMYSWLNSTLGASTGTGIGQIAKLKKGLYIHNIKGEYLNLHNSDAPHIIEYVSVSTPLVTRIWNYLRLLTEAKKFDEDSQEFVELELETFNKMVLYNSKQCSGELTLNPKDTSMNEDYLFNQVADNPDGITIDRNERDWTVNNFRDIREDYSKPIWNLNPNALRATYYIDKVLNEGTLNTDKEWSELETFRDKFLIVRLIFDKFAREDFNEIKLITNFTVEDEQQSER